MVIAARADVIQGVSLVIPAYNEEGAVGDVVRDFRAALESNLLAVLPDAATQGGANFEILVVDDGSSDATARRASEAGATVVSSPQNQGYGLALRRGILASRFEHVMICDADGTYPTTAVKDLVSLAEHFDMVIAERTGPTFRGRGLRAVARSALRWFASFVVGRHVPDVNSGFRIFRKDDCLQYFGFLSPGFSFTTGLTLAMISDARAVAFAPTDYRTRVGESKVRFFRDSLRMAQILVQVIVRHNPIKLFLMLAAVVWTFALSVLAVWIFVGLTALLIVAAAGFLVGVQVFSLGLVAETIRGRRSL